MPEGNDPECTEEAGSPHAIQSAKDSGPDEETAKTASPHAVKSAAETDRAQHDDATPDAKPAKRGKSKSARSRRVPSFLRKVDLFLSPRR
ncbi:MAG TPA: hypothetical protein VEW64_02215 [Methyloceanibacter sp.]|nr:hypothetical protein [Methyloceanibacter sp.]